MFGLTKGVALPVVWVGDTAVAEQESVMERAVRYASTVFHNQVRKELRAEELVRGILKEAEKESQPGLGETQAYRLVKLMVEKEFLDRPRFGFYSLHPDDDKDEARQDELDFDLEDLEEQEQRQREEDPGEEEEDDDDHKDPCDDDYLPY
ncbi:MAG: hypothetical protein LUC33_06315 [Prevotellaceae bacterium]|nr:hypothetical protein [Prevotellaceae bacterium]